MSVRFTAWLSDNERRALTEAANKERTSVNVLIREAIRQYLKLDETPRRSASK